MRQEETPRREDMQNPNVPVEVRRHCSQAVAALSAQPQSKKCEKHPRYVTEPFCPDCRSESERALSAQQEPKPTSDELEKVIADFCENFECDGADGEDEPITDAQRKFARGVIDGLLADPAWDELWGRQIEEMVRQRMAAQAEQVNDATGKESEHGK